MSETKTPFHSAIRDPRGEAMECPSCGLLQDGAPACADCGARMTDADRVRENTATR